MSTTHDDGNATNALALDREGAWVVHDVVLDELVGDDAERPLWAIEVAKQVESDEPSVTPIEAKRLRERLVAYLDGNVPDRDVEPARRVIAALEDRFETMEKAA
jgi:hypothetical protein